MVNENMELKELCLYLDSERGRMPADRDEGDGSSNGTVTGHEDGIVAMDTTGSVTPTPSAPPSNLILCKLEYQKKHLHTL